ncbi:MAG TPA: FlgD immunoglobulin-like domain containing protein [Ignavibacteria bacterium]|nr:FlgD immunoglobulin-like domain containing protein [Ignavibacteria bacterium]
MKLFLTFLLSVLTLFFSSNNLSATPEPYSIELQQIAMPGTPAIHSFAFAQSNGRWLFVGGRTNGLHGFSAGTSFPKQYSNKNIFVVDPSSVQTYSRNIFTEYPFAKADPLRSANMQSFQDGNKLYVIGGYGYDSLSNSLVTFSSLTVFDVEETIQAIIAGTPINPYTRQINDNRIKVCGGELFKLGDYFYLAGGHNFTGDYTRFVNVQDYTNQIKKFKINDNGVSVTISDYSVNIDSVEFHRRDMNVVPAIKPDGVTPYSILYGGVFKVNSDLPYLNPIYIDGNGTTAVDFTFEQKMSQYTCSNLSAFNATTGNMHTTFFGGTSLYYFNEITQTQVLDTLVPFIDDITTLTRYSNGSSEEKISVTKFPVLLGTNAKFILDPAVPKYSNDVIKLNELSGRTYVGYIFGGIRALYPNNTVSFPSDYIFKVYITPNVIGINQISSEIPSGFSMDQNYPNPFNPNTKIRYSIPENNFVELKVYDAMGQMVQTLVNETQTAGTYEVNFDAQNVNGIALSSGIYYYKLSAGSAGNAGSFVETKRMLMLK